MMHALLVISALSAFLCQASATALDDYVWAPDEHYSYYDFGPDHIITGTNLFGNRSWTGYTLNMTSQKWLTDDDFSESSDSGSIWWHYLVVIVPDTVDWTRNASMWVTGWSQTSGFPQHNDEDIALAAALAMGSNIVIGCLFQIPNEHTTFAGDPIQKSRSEDAIIAYTWDHFLKDTSQPEWLLRFPMVKATLRAMDTITDFTQKKYPEANYQFDYYTIAGASKRGWTTWDVGVVDKERVMAICPIVLDAINFVDVEHHQWRSYGGWSWALNDYYEMNIMTRLDTPEMRMLQEEVDPFFYAERLTMPKLVVNAVLDEFQQPDDTDYWWDKMPEPKHFIMTPNAEHSEATGIFEIVPAIGTWLTYLLREQTVPEFTWNISNETGAITAVLDDEGDVYEASVFYAYSCGNNIDGKKRRDFRILSLDVPCECGIGYDGYCSNLKSFWTREILEPTITADGKRSYTAHKEEPGDGRWVAYFIDIKYKEYGQTTTLHDAPAWEACTHLPCDKPGRLEFTSQVSIWPNTFPYEACTGEGCAGYLL